MKTFSSLLVASLVAVSLPAFSQAGAAPAAGVPDAAQLQKLRERIRSDPKTLVMKNLQLTEAEAKAFAPAYDECHVKLDGAQRRVNRAILDYVNAMNSMTDANATKIAKDLLAAEKDEASARKACFDRAAKVLPGKKAARYLQIESKIRALGHFDAAVAIPLVD